MFIIDVSVVYIYQCVASGGTPWWVSDQCKFAVLTPENLNICFDSLLHTYKYVYLDHCTLEICGWIGCVLYQCTGCIKLMNLSCYKMYVTAYTASLVLNIT